MVQVHVGQEKGEWPLLQLCDMLKWERKEENWCVSVVKYLLTESDHARWYNVWVLVVTHYRPCCTLSILDDPKLNIFYQVLLLSQWVCVHSTNYVLFHSFNFLVSMEQLAKRPSFVVGILVLMFEPSNVICKIILRWYIMRIIQLFLILGL